VRDNIVAVSAGTGIEVTTAAAENTAAVDSLVSPNVVNTAVDR